MPSSASTVAAAKRLRFSGGKPVATCEDSLVLLPGVENIWAAAPVEAASSAEAEFLQKTRRVAQAWSSVPVSFQNHTRMPFPKKRKVKKTKQKSSALDEEIPKKATMEADALKQHLVLQRDMAKQAMADREGLRQRLTKLETDLEEAQKDKKDIYEEMIRQHQQLQRQTDIRIQRLEAEKQNLQEQLAACQKNLQRSEEDRAKILDEKDKVVAEMQQRAERMETEYERILHDTLDQLLSKLQTTKLGWETEATLLHTKCKNTLKEFGLNPLEI
ncbi:dynein regulatory complex protein 12 isoform 2-T2 [Liasis olivaceus]